MRSERTPGIFGGAAENRGVAILEFAITMPLLLGLCMAATDFGRLFYHAVVVSNAAGTGAFYGARDKILTGHFSGQEQRAENDMKNITAPGTGAHPVTSTAVQYCTCPGAPGKGGNFIQDNGDPTDPDRYGCNSIHTTPCPGYGPGRVYIKVTVSQPFPSLAPWPIIPSNTIVARTAFQRAQ